MIRAVRQTRKRLFQDCPLESLEWRGLLSTLPSIPSSYVNVSVVAPGSENAGPEQGSIAFGEAIFSDTQITTEPGDGSRTETGPSQLINFDQPVDSLDLGFNDIRLDRVNGDGTTTPLFDLVNWPQPIANNNDGFDLTFTQLLINLDAPLEPGTYQLVIVGGSMISIDLANGRWDPFEDYAFSTFTIGSPASTDPGGENQEESEEEGRGEGGSGGLGGVWHENPAVDQYEALQPNADVQDFTDLGTLPIVSPISSEIQSPIPGKSGVALYRFVVPDGHHWQLGLGAQPVNGAGQFQTSFTLYRLGTNGTWEVVALSDPGGGIRDDARNGLTYLGVDAGTYYLAVTGTFTTPGGLSLSSAGTFQLYVEATPADQPSTVTGFQLNWANPDDSSPAGFSIKFSGPIALNGFGEANTSTPPLEVVDANGKVWEIIPLNYLHQDNLLTMVFGNPLPAGTYTLRIGAVNGLTDLAGWTPVAGGLPNGVLATWTVAEKQSPAPDPYLGILWPKSLVGLTGSGLLDQAVSESSRFVVITPGFYKLQTFLGAGEVEVRILAIDGSTYLDTVIDSALDSQQIYLPIGAYTLIWTGHGAEASQFHWVLNAAKIDWESLLNNGVGQWSTLNLGFGTTTNNDPNSNPASPNSNANSPNSPVTSPVLPHPSTNSGGSTTGGATTAQVTATQPLLLTPSITTPLGQPTAQIQGIAVVGPAVTSEATVVADNSPGLTAGIRYESNTTAGVGVSQSTFEEPPTFESTSASAPTSSPAADPPSQPEMVERSERESREADLNALASADWILGIGEMIQNWLQPSPRNDVVPDESRSNLLSRVLIAGKGSGQDAPMGGEGSDRVERASFGLPLGVVVASAIALRAKDPIRRWWRKDGRRLSKAFFSRNRLASDRNGPDRKSPAATEHHRHIPGPHFRTKAQRVDAQLHHQHRRGI